MLIKAFRVTLKKFLDPSLKNPHMVSPDNLRVGNHLFDVYEIMSKVGLDGSLADHAF